MKIAIVTLPLHSNYGGILQAYALQTILQKMGHDVLFVKYPQKNDFKLCMNNIVSPIINSIGRYTHHYTMRKILKEQNAKISTFRYKYLAKEISITELRSMISKIDAIIVGSDQVWRHYNHLDIRFFYLDFLQDSNIKRIAYAASFGIKDWNFDTKTTASISELANRFSAISVREYDGLNICSKYLGVNAVQVLDPTLLLGIEEYKKLFNKTYMAKISLSTYIITPSTLKDEIISSVEQELDTIAKPLSRMENNPRCVDIKSKSSVEKWLAHLMGSEMLITDSFHGTVFAINFNVPFIIMQNQEAGNSRLFNVLEKFNLQNRMVTSCEQAIRMIKEPINWNSVNKILLDEKEKSIAFIQNALVN